MSCMQLTSLFHKQNFIQRIDNGLLYGNKGVKIHINNEVISMLKIYRQFEPHQHEKGGILIGCFQKDIIEIVDLTHPFPLDRSSRYAFHREDPMHDKVLQAKWKLSEKSLGFAGDWHTHPEG